MKGLGEGKGEGFRSSVSAGTVDVRVVVNRGRVVGAGVRACSCLLSEGRDASLLLLVK